MKDARPLMASGSHCERSFSPWVLGFCLADRTHDELEMQFVVATGDKKSGSPFAHRP